MLSVTRTTAQSKHLVDLLTRIKQTGKPVRIESGADTFYVLSAEQLLMLLGDFHGDASLEDSFRPEEFGLTQDEIAAYEERGQRGANPSLHLLHWTQISNAVCLPFAKPKRNMTYHPSICWNRNTCWMLSKTRCCAISHKLLHSHTDR